MQRSRKNLPSDRSRIIVLDSSWVNQCFSCMHKTGNPTRERLSDQHQRAFASPAYSLTAPINNSIKLQNMSSAAMLFPCIGKRMINIHRGWFACVCFCVMSPSDGIGVKVGLKICWVWVKVHPLASWPPQFSPDRPPCTDHLWPASHYAKCKLVHFSQRGFVAFSTEA